MQTLRVVVQIGYAAPRIRSKPYKTNLANGEFDWLFSEWNTVDHENFTTSNIHEFDI